MNKRLSTSSATLLNSPDKSSQKRSASLNRLNNKVPQQSELPPPKVSQVEQKARRSQINPLESSVISRLLAPTQASLARSKSAAALSSDGKDPPEFHLCPRSAAAGTFQHPLQTQKMPLRSRSIDRLKSTASPVEPSAADSIQKSEMDKQSPAPTAKRPPSPSLSARRRSPSPANVAKRPPSPSTVKHIQRNRPPSPSVLKQRPPSPSSVYKPVPVQRPPLTPSITKKKSEADSKPKDKGEEVPSQEPGASPTSEKESAAVIAKTKDESNSKTVPGTTSAEEAAKILAEKRRLAREQRERDEQERIQKKEEERKIQEEMAKKAIEDKARQEEELSRLEEERRLEDEEQQRKSEEERIREEQERLAELQQQREEAEAKAQEEAERQRQERERIMQQNMQERLERKKRIEEIMKRTRKAEQNAAKSEEKSSNEVMEEEEEEEEEETEERDFEKVDPSVKINGIDSSQEMKTQSEMSSEALPGEVIDEEQSAEMPKEEAGEVFMNGDEQTVEQKTGGSLYLVPPKDSSSSAKETVIQTSEIVHVNEADHTTGFVPNLNGKSSAWTFEEIIDLGVHAKSTKLSSDGFASDSSDQNLNDAATFPPNPKVAFEEDGAVNTLTKPIETPSEL
ncbi:MAP7 domain-containing protein 3 isoform X3 [Tachyglossus aculeatus]|nr:MAP7 domain-containing protein 3 isoform X3 [Tachyglossus aculeatus]XP_038604091.1 MAP7 domain-containing protein 3 isoform X3 [Tachyglossus aculeatus]